MFWSHQNIVTPFVIVLGTAVRVVACRMKHHAKVHWVHPRTVTLVVVLAMILLVFLFFLLVLRTGAGTAVRVIF
jgi:uncharacterized membrane protein YbhN (UPF0104 family)